MRTAKKVFIAALLLSVLFAFTTLAAAHPMGNFSVSHYAKLTVNANYVTVLYLLDLAEIPTYQDIRQYGLTPKNDDPSVIAYLAKQSELLRNGITLDDNGQALHLECISKQA